MLIFGGLDTDLWTKTGLFSQRAEEILKLSWTRDAESKIVRPEGVGVVLRDEFGEIIILWNLRKSFNLFRTRSEVELIMAANADRTSLFLSDFKVKGTDVSLREVHLVDALINPSKGYDKIREDFGAEEVSKMIGTPYDPFVAEVRRAHLDLTSKLAERWREILLLFFNDSKAYSTMKSERDRSLASAHAKFEEWLKLHESGDTTCDTEYLDWIAKEELSLASPLKFTVSAINIPR